MNRATLVIAGLTALAFAYPVAMRVLAVRMQPTRIKMLKLGDRLLASPVLRAEQKAIIKSMLDDTFSPKFLFIVALFLPFYILFRLTIRRHVSSPLLSVPKSEAENIRALQNYHLRSIAAANPLCAAIVCVEIVVLWVPFRLLGLLSFPPESNGTVRADARNVMSEIEAQRALHHSLPA